MGTIGGRLDGLSLAATKRQAIDNGDGDGGASLASNESSATTVVDTDEENCKLDLVEMLLESGADPKIGNEIRDTPLHFACEQVGTSSSICVSVGLSVGCQCVRGDCRLYLMPTSNELFALRFAHIFFTHCCYCLVNSLQVQSWLFW